jgi:hypothetical protein
MLYVTMKRKAVKDIECPRKRKVYQVTKRLLFIRNVSVLRRGESVVKKSPYIQIMVPTGAMQ